MRLLLLKCWLRLRLVTSRLLKGWLIVVHLRLYWCKERLLEKALKRR
jgi:hypothetical protein